VGNYTNFLFLIPLYLSVPKSSRVITISITGNGSGGTRNIAIAPFPERSQTFTGKATRWKVNGYCTKNNDLLQKGFALGGWFDKGNAATYLDITAPVPLEKQSEAISLGKNANQIAGFNLSDFTEIPLGGTGEFNSLISSFDERLNEALALIRN
jgi:hypothetical protein